MNISQFFNLWNVKKQEIHRFGEIPPFYEGNIVWFSCGQNIGTEIFGKGEGFFRPGIIVKKVFFDGYIIIPLSSQKREGSYYYEFIDSKKQIQYALFHQIKYIDGRRIVYKKSQVPDKIFEELKIAFKNFL